MRRIFPILAVSLILIVPVGCASTPVEQAAEIRAVFTQVQTTVGEQCKQPDVDKGKCAKAEKKLDDFAPWVDKIEIVAAKIEENPLESLEFNALVAVYRPQIQAMLIEYVIDQWLGRNLK